MTDYARQRLNMINGQLKPCGLRDRGVLAAMGSLPRELFTPPRRRYAAYLDEDLPAAPGRYLMAPAVFARLAQACRIKSGLKALVVGCGAGYGAAVLAKIGADVVALDSDESLAGEARAHLKDAGLTTVRVRVGQHQLGWPRSAPYDFILLEGAASQIPPALLKQLRDGGRLAGVLRGRRRDDHDQAMPASRIALSLKGAAPPCGRAFLMTRDGDSWSRRWLFDAATPLLSGLDETADLAG